ncbi:MAG: metallophosphoesterase [Lachnospiraceae bacterium]|nr:metallophosphoesterase [Lachnospiraceae bacterium]
MATYAVSDLHGQYQAFLEGLSKIGFGKDDFLYLIGDAIDRGPDGIKILRHIMREENMDLLIGNHEFMMLNSMDPEGESLTGGKDEMLWLYYNGGDATLRQFAKLSPEERKELLSWLCERVLIKPLEAGGKKFCLTHSGYNEECEDKKYSELDYDTVWNIVWRSYYRDEYETHCPFVYENYPYTFLTGHVPVQRIQYGQGRDPGKLSVEPWIFKNLINIDGGCSMGADSRMPVGAIFYRLDDGEFFPVPLDKSSER